MKYNDTPATIITQILHIYCEREQREFSFPRKEAIVQCSSFKATIGINLLKKWSRKEIADLAKMKQLLNLQPK